MNPLTVLRLAANPEFQRGLLVGVVALAVLLIVRRMGWLLTWGVAAFGALAWSGQLHLEANTPQWAVALTGAIAIAGSWAFQSLRRHAPEWSVGVLFALWVLGVWGTVPDTERAVVTMGAAAALLPALWPKFRVPLGWPGGLIAISALGFVTMTDGAARTGAMIGAFGMVGMPLVGAGFAITAPRGRVLSPWWLIGAYALHVIVSGRLAAQLSAPTAATTVVIISSIVTGGLVWIPSRRGAPPPVRRTSGGPDRPLVIGLDRPPKR